MIKAFTGKTGSGKTFLMIQEAYKAWRKGRDIYSNTKLLFIPHIRYKKVNELTGKKEYDYKISPKYKPNKKRGKISYFEHVNEIIGIRNGLVLFDEAQVLFNARSWESLPEEFQYKLQQHRKHNIDLICTTQNMGTIDITYRRLVHSWVHCKNLLQLGRSPRILIGVFQKQYKDVDELYSSVDDLVVTTLKNRYKIIHFFSHALYDTMYDIGFRKLKIVWLNQYDSRTKKMKQIYLIIPKKMLLNKALTDIRLFHSLSNLKGYKNSRTT